jgi:hypothetical protein
MKKYADGKYIKRIEKRLLKVLKQEYRADGLFVEVEKVDIYFPDGPMACIEIRYGAFSEGGRNWAHKFELPLTDGKVEFLAGQFYQRLYDYENGMLKDTDGN